MKPERTRSQKHNVVIADSNVLFRRGLCSLLAPEPDFAVMAEVASEPELLVALERHAPDVVIAASSFLSASGLFATNWSGSAHAIPVVCLLPEPLDDGSPFTLIPTVLTILRDQTPASLVKELRNLLRPEAYTQKQASDLRALSFGSQTATPDVLTHREKEVVRLLSDGLTVREAAEELGLSSKTVEAHTLNLMRKLDIHKRSSLIEYAIAVGMTEQRVVA